jgi:hypothetical protein
MHITYGRDLLQFSNYLAKALHNVYSREYMFPIFLKARVSDYSHRFELGITIYM